MAMEGFVGSDIGEIVVPVRVSLRRVGSAR